MAQNVGSFVVESCDYKRQSFDIAAPMNVECTMDAIRQMQLNSVNEKYKWPDSEFLKGRIEIVLQANNCLHLFANCPVETHGSLIY